VARRRKDDGTDQRLGLFERGLLSFMGPPQLGDVHAPVADLPPRPVDLCPRCGLDRDEHEVVRTARLTYTRCSAD
jgi:hypothetical protein